MAPDQEAPDAEFQAMQTVYAALNGLAEDARGRVIEYVSDRLGLALKSSSKPVDRTSEPDVADTEQSNTLEPTSTEFSSFAELYDEARPKSQSDKALVGGYWIQICQGAESFDGYSVNKELKNLGQGVPNITSALDVLKAQKPALALQLKKSGKSRQARKTYKITVAGIKSVEAMIGG
jgi:hypothetical protein